MTTEQMIAIVQARQACFAAAERTDGYEARVELQDAARALLAIERRHPALQAEAFAAIAGPRSEWEIA